MKILLICASPVLYFYLLRALQELEGVEVTAHYKLNSVPPLDKDERYDLVIVGSFWDEYDIIGFSEIKKTWKNTKMILIMNLENPKQIIRQKTIANGIVYLYWHFKDRFTFQQLIEDSLIPELMLKEKKSISQVSQQPKPQKELFLKERKIHDTLIRTLRKSDEKIGVFSSELVWQSKKVKKSKRLKQAIVVIASSTGGFSALRRVVTTLPSDFQAPIVIAQHMPKGFAETLVRSLNTSNEYVTVVLANNCTLKQRHVYIIPYDYHGVLIEEGGKVHLKLNQEPKEHSLRPAADPLFRSVAQFEHFRPIAAILTGMGSDGTEGGKEIKKSGGTIICQDKESSAVWGMPRMAVETGICDKIVSLSEVGPTLFELTK